MRTPKYRLFIDKIMLAGRTSNSQGKFHVPLKKGLWKARNELTESFFGSSENQSDETRVVSSFLRACFEFDVSQEEQERNSDDDASLASENAEEKSSRYDGRRFLSHKATDVDVQRTVLEFGRTFCSGSIAGGVLRD